MAKPELVLPIGLPASGKTSFAKAWQNEDPDGRVRVNYDDLRLGMYGPDSGWHQPGCAAQGGKSTIREDGCGCVWVWNRKDEEAMKASARRIVKAALQAGLSVVVDNTNLSRHVRASWQDFGRDLGAEYIERDIDTPIEECIRRDRLRARECGTCHISYASTDPTTSCKMCGSVLGGARVGQAVIDGMALRYGLLDWEEHGRNCHIRGTCTGASTVPICVVDIDSTIADDNKRIHHITPALHDDQCDRIHCQCLLRGYMPYKDWASYFAEVANDTPILPMVKLLERLHDHLIVLVSGRPVSNGATPVGILTEDWLLRHNIHWDRLFLKTDNFHQKSPDFKQSILEYLPKDRVAYVFDDDPACLSMYRSEGLYALGVPGSGKR